MGGQDKLTTNSPQTAIREGKGGYALEKKHPSPTGGTGDRPANKGTSYAGEGEHGRDDGNVLAVLGDGDELRGQDENHGVDA